MPNPDIPSPEEYGWNLVNGTFQRLMTKLPPAPSALIELVKCGCKATRCSSNVCKCRKNNLMYTEFCTCCDGVEGCDNAEEIGDTEMDDEADDF